VATSAAVAPFHKLGKRGDRVLRKQYAPVQLYRRSLTRIVAMEPDRLQGLLGVNIVVRPSRLVLVPPFLGT
jgi:hypothetical protein